MTKRDKRATWQTVKTVRLAAIAAVLFCCAGAALAMNEIFIDRIEERGSVLVPLRGVFEALGATVQWDDKGQVADIVLKRRTVNLFLNDYIAYVNGKPRRMTTPPRLIHGRVYIPLRFVGEALGVRVVYKSGVATILPTSGDGLKIHLQARGTPVKQKPREQHYIAKWTSTRAATASDMTGNSNWELTLMREEIRARKGMPFQNDFVRDYFLRQTWYHPDYDYTPIWLTPLEMDNFNFIAAYQKRLYGNAAVRP